MLHLKQFPSTRIAFSLSTLLIHSAFAQTQENSKSDDSTDNAIDLSSVVVYVGENQGILGMNPVLSQSEVGQGTINQTQMNIIQATNMATVLDKIPGVGMSGSPRPGGQTINIWGMNESKSVPIMVDGALKTFDKYRQGTLYVDPDLIKAVDVQKGGFDPSIGNGGFGGSVRMTTKDATDFLREGQSVGAMLKTGYHTNNNQRNYAAAVYGKNHANTMDGLIYFSKTLSKDVRLADHERYRGSAIDQYSYLVKSNLYLGEESKLTLSLNNTRYKGWMPFAAMGGNTINVSSMDDYEWKRRIFYREQKDRSYSANFEYAPSDNPWVNLTVDLTHSETKQHDQKIKPQPGQKKPSASLSTLGKENWTAYRNTSLHIKNQSIIETGVVTQTITVGLQYLRKQQNATMFYDQGSYGKPEFNHGYFTPPFLPAGRQTVISAYVMDEIQLGQFTLTPSLRYDHVKNQSFGNVAGYTSTNAKDGHDYRSVTYQGFSPRIALYWQPIDQFAAFVDYSRSWQAPNIDEQYTVQGKGISGPNGTSRDLSKEKLSALRFGVMGNFSDLLTEDDQLFIRATAFHNRVNHEVIRKIGAIYCESHHATGNNSGCGKPMSAFHNGRGYTIKGLELEAKYESTYVFGGLAASLMKGQRRGSPRDVWYEQKTWLRDIPPRELTATIGFHVPQYHFSMGWQSQFVRKQTRTPSTIDAKAGVLSYQLTPGYSVHGLFMSYTPDDRYAPNINLTVDNLFNKSYAPYLNDGVKAPGLDVRLSISYQF
ncbi:TonB-dependent hemoglobin/transferrin/lactoferrin family receptor [Wohlfahrtiimonas chitiniclastica]|uniref:TonB-dependent hemoglobin/transferrin/lactoferrin family receptor n=1 Tax=Wohlfahrtiimonas chitiniclastica TaxID=400946 RepID=UPI0021581D14|nr:TonB-dependent hemoglobin/transferrin/lactoferrin family receptor [Wohlfahrtiimonas chitiniclastica]MDC7252863.1 TonB-dependent receptor [Wohlfahrtiimonas chitiniclastica]